jgi:acetyltransferase-like isoleucine patch superfamily enzyme
MTRYLLRASRMVYINVCTWTSTCWTRLKFSLHEVKYGNHLKSSGVPVLDLSLRATFIVLDYLSLNNNHYFNTIGRQQKCCFSVANGAVLKIGNHVGISCSTIVCKSSIEIGDHVEIGGNCEIYDTDFHDLDYRKRSRLPEDYSAVKNQPIIIKKNAFIGAHSTILKGVTIGEGAIIGACSVVTKDIPSMEIWAGNPIRFISLITN